MKLRTLLWDIYYYLTLPIRIIIVLIMVFSLTEDDYPQLSIPSRTADFCEESDIATKPDQEGN